MPYIRDLAKKKGKWEVSGREGLICKIFGHQWGYAVNKIEKRVIGINVMDANIKISKCKRCGAKERLFVTFIY
jgi:hypothetical protein